MDRAEIDFVGGIDITKLEDKMKKSIYMLAMVMLLTITGCGQRAVEELETPIVLEVESEQASALATEPSTKAEEENSMASTEISLHETQLPDSSEVETAESEGNILADEYVNFGSTVDAVDAKGYDKFDDFTDIMNQDFTGTWYDPEAGEAIRLTNEGAYVYIPYLEEYGNIQYEWELIDRSDRNLCPELAIYISGKEAGPLAYYVAGFRGDYFWCNAQGQIFYRQ